jgi:hypothetical protein
MLMSTELIAVAFTMIIGAVVALPVAGALS